MGGHGGLNILPQKKWNVYNFDNREIVRKDEEKFAREEAEKSRKNQLAEAEFRLEQLRRKRGHQEVDEAELEEVSNKKYESVEALQMNKSMNLFAGYEADAGYGKNAEYEMDQKAAKDKNDRMITKYLGAGSIEMMKKEESKPFYMRKVNKEEHLDLASFIEFQKKSGNSKEKAEKTDYSYIARPGSKATYSGSYDSQFDSKDSSSFKVEKQLHHKDLLDPMNSIKEMLYKKRSVEKKLTEQELLKEKELINSTGMYKSSGKDKYLHDKNKHHDSHHRSSSKSDSKSYTPSSSDSSKPKAIKTLNELRLERIEREKLEQKKVSSLLECPEWASKSVNALNDTTADSSAKYNEGFRSWAVKTPVNRK